MLAFFACKYSPLEPFNTYVRSEPHKLRNAVSLDIFVELIGINNVGTALLIIVDIGERHEGVVLATVGTAFLALETVTRIALLVRLPGDSLLLQKVNNGLTINVRVVITVDAFNGTRDQGNLGTQLMSPYSNLIPFHTYIVGLGWMSNTMVVGQHNAYNAKR